MRVVRSLLLLVTALVQVPLHAGEIAGLRSSLPPFLQARFELSLSNDFLGRGGSVDDFRTQQIIISANLGERWTATLDHSVLTLSDASAPGRIDQLSGALGYRFINAGANRVTAGLGFRSVGDFAGERMQNGFHRLIGSDIEFLPYSDRSDTQLTAWLDAERFAVFRETAAAWRIGYWLRASSLATSDGQWDGTLAAMATISKSGFDAWAGLRQDWRSGYNEPVQRATASAEQDLAAVIGLRFGSLVLETVQQFENDASYGQLRLLSLEADAGTGDYREPRAGFEFGVLMPDIHLHLAGRFRSQLLVDDGSSWQESILVSVDTGEPQLGDDASVFVETVQLGLGMEWERSLSGRSDWLSAYTSLAAGWRREQLSGEGALAGESSAAVDRGVLIVAGGFRFHGSALGERWRYRIQTGLTAWLPFGDATVSMASTDYTIQEMAIGASLGVSFELN